MLGLWYTIEHFFTFLSKLYNYGKLLWKDEDWDYSYILVLLQYKLKRTRIAIQKGCHTNSAKEAKRIRTCELLIDRITKHEYYHNFKETEEDWESLIDPVYGKTYRLTEKARVKAKRFYIHAEKQEQQDYTLLFYYLNKYIRTWWD